MSDSKMMTIQLIGKDDSSFDDAEVLTGRWQAYIDSYVSVCILSCQNFNSSHRYRMRVPRGYQALESTHPTFAGESSSSSGPFAVFDPILQKYTRESA